MNNGIQVCQDLQCICGILWYIAGAELHLVNNCGITTAKVFHAKAFNQIKLSFYPPQTQF